jgi:hypothetical protein
MRGEHPVLTYDAVDLLRPTLFGGSHEGLNVQMEILLKVLEVRATWRLLHPLE